LIDTVADSGTTATLAMVTAIAVAVVVTIACGRDLFRRAGRSK
jgi:hypothetical protein